MSYSYEAALELLGDDAQTAAGNLIVYNGTHVLVGTTSETGVFALTTPGLELLNARKAAQMRDTIQKAAQAESKAAQAESKAAQAESKAKRKVEPKPESAKVEVGPADALSDIDVDLD